MRLTKERPSDWRTKRLVAVAKLISGGTPSRKVPEYFQGDVPWITGNDVVSFRTSKAREYITEEAIENSATHLLPKGSILFVTRTGVGKVSIAEVDICISQDLTGVICKEDIALPEYVARYLISLSEKIKYRQRGSTIKGVTREFVEQIEIPLPPLPVQKKIAAILEKADAAREKRRQANQLTEQFLQSAFLEMFGDPAKNPKKWEIDTVRGIASNIQYGYTESSSNQEIGPKFLRITDIQNGCVDWENVPYCKCDNVEKYRLSNGDILFTRTGATTGKSFLVTNCPSAVFASYLIRVQLRKEIMPVYVYHFFQTQSYWNQIKKNTTGSTQGGFNASKLSKVTLPVPPLSEQQKFAALVRKVESLRARQRQSGQELETLFNSLMQRVFKGDL